MGKSALSFALQSLNDGKVQGLIEDMTGSLGGWNSLANTLKSFWIQVFEETAFKRVCEAVSPELVVFIGFLVLLF